MPGAAAIAAAGPVVGAGTGFGVACLVRHGAQAIPLITEGGHIAFAPNDDEQVRILQKLKARFQRVSVERILSGTGLESLYRIQQQFAGCDGAECPLRNWLPEPCKVNRTVGRP